MAKILLVAGSNPQHTGPSGLQVMLARLDIRSIIAKHDTELLQNLVICLGIRAKSLEVTALRSGLSNAPFLIIFATLLIGLKKYNMFNDIPPATLHPIPALLPPRQRDLLETSHRELSMLPPSLSQQGRHRQPTLQRVLVHE